jgi:hypothetical protein
MRLLEEQFFRLNPAGLLWMLLIGGVLSLVFTRFVVLDVACHFI